MEKTCRICNGPLPPRARTLCSEPCRKEERRESVRKAIAKYEAESGEGWHARYRATYRAADQRRYEAGFRPREAYPETYKAIDQRRDARKRGAATAVPVRRADIYERDSWKCGICGEAIDRDVKYPAPGSPSLDHILPLALGGSHDPSNLQAAHLHCNVSKGARIS